MVVGAVVTAVLSAVSFVASPAVAAAAHRPGPVAHASVYSTASTVLGVRWVNPHKGTFRAIVVRIARGTHAPSGPHYGSAVGTTTGHTLTAHRLRPATEYTFAIFACTRSDASARGCSTARVVRAVTAPAPVGTITATVTDAAASLAWSIPPTSSFRGLTVRYRSGRTAPATTSSGSAGHPATPHARAVTLSGLQPATTYSVSVWTYDKRGHHSSPVHRTITTRRAPGPVTRPHATITSVSGSRVTETLTWADPTSPDFSGVIIRRSGGATAPTRTTGTAIADVPAPRRTLAATLPGPGTYTFAFFAHDSSGHLAAPTTLTVSTDTRSSAPPAIQGRVTTSTGAPLVGATVTASDTGDDATASSTTHTDTDGYYTIHAGMVAGHDYRLCADKPSGASEQLVGTTCLGTDVTPGFDAATRGVDLVVRNGATIDGRVTGGGAGVAGAQVVALDPAADDYPPGVPVAVTDSDGGYRISGLAAGHYVVCVDTTALAAPGLVSACSGGIPWQPGEPSPVASTALTVGAAASVTSDLALAPAGGVAGQVRTSADVPVDGVVVTARDARSAVVLSTTRTTADGRYRLGALAPSATGYQVCFDTATSSAPTLRGECWQGVAWNRDIVPADAALVPVDAASLTGDVDATLADGSSVSGTVTGGGVALGGVTVHVFDAATDESIGATQTGADGHYTVASLAAVPAAVVCVDAADARGPAANGYLDRCLGAGTSTVTWTAGSPPAGDAVSFGLTDGAATTGKDLALPIGTAVSGQVTGDSGGLGGLTVYAITPYTERVLTTATTDPLGAYRLIRLDPSSVAVCVSGSATQQGADLGYAGSCARNAFWNGRPNNLPTGLTPVSTTAGKPVDFALPRLTALSGTVTTGAAYAPVSGAAVQVFLPSGQDAASATVTAADGTYTVPQLPAGAYRVCVDGAGARSGSSAAGYSSECVGNVAWDGEDLPPGPVVTTSAGRATHGVDLGLEPDGRLTGHVAESGDHVAVRGATVLAYSNSGDVAATVKTTSTGAFTLALDPHFAVTVCVDPSGATTATNPGPSLRAQCVSARDWDGPGNDLPDGAITMTARSAASTSLGTVTLTRAGSVTGVVSGGGTNAPVADAVVYAFDADGDESASTTTDATGGYALRGLGDSGPGYQICVYAPVPTGTDPQLMSQCYRDVAWDGGFDIPAGARPFPVRAGTAYTGIDFSLGVDSAAPAP